MYFELHVYLWDLESFSKWITKIKFPLTFARFPIESTSGRGSFLAAIELSFRRPPGQRLSGGEHHDIGGGRCSTGTPESGTTGVGRLQHPRCRASKSEHDVRPLVLLLRLDTRLSLLILPEDRLPSFPFRLAYQPFPLLYLVSSANRSESEFLKQDF